MKRLSTQSYWRHAHTFQLSLKIHLTVRKMWHENLVGLFAISRALVSLSVNGLMVMMAKSHEAYFIMELWIAHKFICIVCHIRGWTWTQSQLLAFHSDDLGKSFSKNDIFMYITIQHLMLPTNLLGIVVFYASYHALLYIKGMNNHKNTTHFSGIFSSKQWYVLMTTHQTKTYSENRVNIELWTLFFGPIWMRNGKL